MGHVTKSLGEICDEVDGTIRTGPFGSQLHESDYVDEGTPVVMPKNIAGGRVSTMDIAQVREDEINRLSQHKLICGDIVYGRRGDIGRRALITERESGWLCGTGCLRISLGDSLLDPKYLYYYLGQPNVITWIYNQAVGATMPNLNTTILRSVPITYPSLEIQRKIASVLSAYDDLIENNTRRIEILEEMAQAIYREWFVNFRFPGHEKVGMVDSPLGRIPEGWEVKPVAELLSYHIGGGWGKEEQSEQYPDAAYVVRGTDIPSARHTSVDTCPLRFHKRSNLASRRLQHQDIVFEVSGGSKDQPVGRALLVGRHLLGAFDGDVMCASFCKLLRLNVDVLLPLILYQHLLEIYRNKKISKYQVQSTGISNFKFKFFLESELVAIPDMQIQTTFDELVSALYDAIGLLGARNTNLRQTRDLLLPKLISGEVNVEGLSDEMIGGKA